MSAADFRRALAAERRAFQARFAPEQAATVWEKFAGRIAVVLSGGGARGAYEAGVLLAFQDARLPTHILSATSVGSINAASFAAHSESTVGNSEPLADNWLDLTPPTMGIEWTRYVFMLAGLIAVSAGLGNLVRQWLWETGHFTLELRDPKLTWLLLALAGAAVLLFLDHLPYVGYVAANALRRGPWRPHPRRLLISLAGNLLVGGFVVSVVVSTGLLGLLLELIPEHPGETALVVAGIAALFAARRAFRAEINVLAHQVLRLPFRSGLFANFERSRYLRDKIPARGLRASPIRVLITVTDLERGTARFFSNAYLEALASDPGADAAFIATEVEPAEDLLGAVVASSAVPVAYEAFRLGERLYSDGGLVTNQPIRPAVRLGADVLFLVTPQADDEQAASAETFLDVALRSLGILLAQSLATDLGSLESLNRLCERHATALKVRPEQIVLDFGPRRYRFLKAITVRPRAPLPAAILDFNAATIGPAIIQGYRDGGAAVGEFLIYARLASFAGPKHILRLTASTAAPASS